MSAIAATSPACIATSMPGRTAPRRWTRRPSTSVLEFLERRRIATLDITGGAPELNANFRRLVTRRARHGRASDGSPQPDRPGAAGPGRSRRVPRRPAGRDRRLDALLPAGQRRQAARQGRVRRLDPRPAAPERARLRARRHRPRAQPRLQPARPVAAAAAGELEADYKRVLGERFGIVFNNLFTLANMPIQRFGAILLSKGNSTAICTCCARASRREPRRRDVPQPAVGRLPRLCLRLRLQPDARPAAWARRRERAHLRDLLDDDITGNPIRVAGHCFGCTAGQGSSCGGALKEAAE